MAISNRERVSRAVELLGNGLAPFVERELKAVHGDIWQALLADGAPMPRGGRRQAPAGGASKPQSAGGTPTPQPQTAGATPTPQPQSQRRPNLADPQVLLGVMWNHWNDVFARTLGQAERSLVSELREVRNRWAHNDAFSGNDAYRALDSAGRLLTAVSAAEAAEIEQMRMDLLRVQFDEQRRQEMRKASFAPTEGKPQGGLKPWREVATPHADVSSGRYQQAEFAADLWQVYQNEGSDEYKHPIEFFRRTFLTAGLAQLLIRALLRLAGKGGDPVVELQTNFGGGKTHALLALWHLFSGTPASELPGVDELAKEAGVDVAEFARLQAGPHSDAVGHRVRRAVIVGTKISPGQPQKKTDGTVVRTLWGEIAWQLGGKEGYKLVKESDETGTNPGDALKELFNKYSPCLILIDEWVAYARQLHDGSSLPGGTFDTQFTFAQSISESAKAAKNTLLVVSVPSSDNEIGGEWGKKALERIKNAIGRVESSWRPASPDEGFEIVRRRLFQPLTNEQAKQRDAVSRAFSELYGAQQQEFPTECREADYERRIKMAYPIHPELFDRLYNDWSTLDKFQRTRGVLRLMAAVIHALWERQDGNLLILPANVPVDDSRVQFELTRYMDDQWVPVIEKDVDGSNSLPLSLDRENPNLGRYSASRRVARTIYMGSAPIQRAANRGIDERRVKLGCVQPGEAVATFGDALRRLTDRATYLYIDGKRYWYSTQPTVTRLADDRAGQLTDDDVRDELEKRLRDEARSRGDFAKVHACAAGGDIPDEREARLVLLGPEHPHTAKEAASPARKEAAAILDARGSAPRNYKNTLVFLAADATRLRELEAAARQYLAWRSIWDDRESLNLDQFQTKQAEAKRKNADETVESRIPETYQWLIVPGQSDPKGQVEWTEFRLLGQDTLAIRAAKKLRSAEQLMVQLGGVRLRHELDRVPLWRGNHVGIKQLADDLPRYLYLPRLRDEDVLLAAIMDGVANLHWTEETFASAESWDEARGRYTGLRAGQQVRVLTDSASVLVKSNVAAAEMEADRQQAAAKAATTATAGGQTGATPPEEPSVGGATSAVDRSDGSPSAPPKLGRFHGSVQIDPIRLGRDASRIAEEVVQHLAGIVDANVEITLEIHAELPDGATDKLVRDVTENCRTLKFRTYGFEEA